MLTKIYAAVWAIVAITAGGLFVSGFFTMLVGVVFGFIVFGLTFAGMMCVLPYEVSHPKQKTPKAQPAIAFRVQPDRFIDHAREFAAELLSPDGVEIRKPKYH